MGYRMNGSETVVSFWGSFCLVNVFILFARHGCASFSHDLFLYVYLLLYCVPATSDVRFPVLYEHLLCWPKGGREARQSKTHAERSWVGTFCFYSIPRS